MAPSAEDIRKTVERYIEAVATGTVDDVVALYAEGAPWRIPWARSRGRRWNRCASSTA